VSHYKSNVRDQVFNLFEVFGVDEAFCEGPYSDWTLTLSVRCWRR
jgi:Acyl-CoA dehydrogenase N terminal